MQIIIMTVGTSLLTNRDPSLPDAQKRPWSGQNQISDRDAALAWMEQTNLELISAETNTLWRLDPGPDDVIILLRSQTPEGQDCSETLRLFLTQKLEQRNVKVIVIPGINYDLDSDESALEKMAKLLESLINEAQGNVTLAATGGFKAQTMIMGIVGNNLGVPVCYVHEEYRGLVYLPYLYRQQERLPSIQSASLPVSSVSRDQVISTKSNKQEPHRPAIWKKVERMLPTIPWVEGVYYHEAAYKAPVNGVKGAPDKTKDGCNIVWMNLQEKNNIMAIAIETTGYTPEHLQDSLSELRQRLGRLL